MNDFKFRYFSNNEETVSKVKLSENLKISWDIFLAIIQGGPGEKLDPLLRDGRDVLNP